MKLIEYKPDLGKVIIVDIKNIPESFNIEEIQKIIKVNQPVSLFPLLESKPTVVDMGSTWVHPDYRVPEDKFVVGYDPYGFSEEKGEIKVYKTKSSDSFDGTSLNHFWLPFPDPEGLNEVNPEVWEAAKPKLNEGLMHQLKKKPKIYGTAGELRTGRTGFNHMFDLRSNFEIESSKYLPDDYVELYYLSESPLQTADWINRKKKYPLLTADNLLWVDKMVDKIFAKYVGYAADRTNHFFISEKFRPMVTKDKFPGPIF